MPLNLAGLVSWPCMVMDVLSPMNVLLGLQHLAITGGYIGDKDLLLHGLILPPSLFL